MIEEKSKQNQALIPMQLFSPGSCSQQILQDRRKQNKVLTGMKLPILETSRPQMLQEESKLKQALMCLKLSVSQPGTFTESSDTSVNCRDKDSEVGIWLSF